MAAERKRKMKRKAGGRLKSPSLRLMTVCVVFSSRLHSFCSGERAQRSDYVHEQSLCQQSGTVKERQAGCRTITVNSSDCPNLNG